MWCCPPPGWCGWTSSDQTGNAPPHLPGCLRWSLMELPPSPGVRPGRLAGFHRANPSTPLDASSYVSESLADPVAVEVHFQPMLLPTDEPLSPGYAEPAPEPVRSSRSHL